MKNPYLPPATPITVVPGDDDTPGTGLLAAGLICALLTAIVPMFVVPAFTKVFDSFGSDLPFLTITVLRYYLAFWLLPVLVLIVRLFWPVRRNRAKVSCLTGVIGMLLALLVSAIALYLPIFKMGSVV
ncbi:MAG: hypothetical protein JSS58_08480 [Proteobacteria bacterium]|nr:hypothetical protein [Pseudomonadota bacterium]